MLISNYILLKSEVAIYK